jgi:hypothetical protein
LDPERKKLNLPRLSGTIAAPQNFFDGASGEAHLESKKMVGVDHLGWRA